MKMRSKSTRYVLILLASGIIMIAVFAGGLLLGTENTENLYEEQFNELSELIRNIGEYHAENGQYPCTADFYNTQEHLCLASVGSKGAILYIGTAGRKAVFIRFETEGRVSFVMGDNENQFDCR